MEKDGVDGGGKEETTGERKKKITQNSSPTVAFRHHSAT